MVIELVNGIERGQEPVAKVVDIAPYLRVRNTERPKTITEERTIVEIEPSPVPKPLFIVNETLAEAQARRVDGIVGQLTPCCICGQETTRINQDNGRRHDSAATCGVCGNNAGACCLDYCPTCGDVVCLECRETSVYCPDCRDQQRRDGSL